MGIALVFYHFCDLIALGLDQGVGFFALEFNLVVLSSDEFHHGVGLF